MGVLSASDFPPPEDQQRRKWFGAAVVSGAVLGLTLGWSIIPAGAAPTGATITVSGAVNGKLSTPSADCQGVTAKSGELDFFHSLRGNKAHGWSVFFTAPHSGTWRGVGVASPSSFSLQASTGITESWTGRSGSFTTNGHAGHVNMVLQPQIGSNVHGLVHVKGTWNCP
jgi:hypothetical protein